MKRQVVVTLQYEGTHSWPECPLEYVSFLRYQHRHMFHIKCWKNVEHNDRDVEIIMLKRQIIAHLNDVVPSKEGSFGRMSCEDIAQMLLADFKLAACEVLEDGENGAYLCL